MDYCEGMPTLISTLLGRLSEARSTRRAEASADVTTALAQSERERYRAAHDRFEAEARRLTDAATEAVLRSVGHELRSPLASIVAASTLQRPISSSSRTSASS